VVGLQSSHGTVRPAVVGAALVLFLAACTSEEPQRAVRSPVTIVFVGRLSLPDLLSIPCLRGLAASGGAALMSPASRVHVLRELGASSPPQLRIVDAAERGDPAGAARSAAEGLCSRAEPRLVVVAGSDPRGGPAGEPALPVIVSTGIGSDATPRALISAPIDRPGLVSVDDLAATVYETLGEPLPDDVAGSAVRPVDRPAPTELYRRYLEQRRLVVPVGTVAGLYVGVAGLAGIWALVRRRRLPPWATVFASGLAISIFPLGLSLLEVGHLDHLTYLTALPFVAAVTALGSWLLLAVARQRGAGDALAVAGGGTLIALAVEWALGWSAALTPLLGGSQLDGGRFYGMPNVEIGLLLGATIAVAQRLPMAWEGAALAFGAGLFAGLPFLGGNVGGAFALCAAAGIWLGTRRGLPWWTTALLAALFAASGEVIVFAANRLSAVTTYVTRALDEANGPGGFADRYGARLRVGIDLIARNPFALIPVIGTLVLVWIAARPPSVLRGPFEAHPVWRDAVLTIGLGSIVAYLVEDSGAAALGLGFGTGVGTMLFLSLRSSIGGAPPAEPDQGERSTAPRPGDFGAH
jgi:hypothetical protein